MQTGENEQALRKIVDFTRYLGILVLFLHFYFTCYGTFEQLHITYPIVDRVLANIYKLSIFKSTLITKLVAMAFLIASLIGSKGKKDQKVKVSNALIYVFVGLALYFLSGVLFSLRLSNLAVGMIYMAVTTAGFLLFITGVSQLFRIINIKLTDDIFNKDNETFPQEERKLENEYSINLPAQYNFKGKIRNSWINIINPFRGMLVMGSPGAGKSYFVIRHIITQHIKKGFSMLIYDFKFDDLSVIAYNALLKYAGNYKKKPSIWFIDFDKIKHRCNPLEPGSMTDITDAMESSRTFMLGLNREWIKKQGDFFVESPINFVTALIWFLRKYQDGKYCTLPHAIELAQVDYKYLFALLKMEPEIEVLINPFISAWQNEAYDQLEGQVASAKISMARLVSPAVLIRSWKNLPMKKLNNSLNNRPWQNKVKIILN